MTKDLRPLVARNKTNGVSRAEAHRDEIYGWFEQIAAIDDVEILLVKSPPHNSSVWVAVEGWVPAGADDFTRRTRVEIELIPRDFCRWPVVLNIKFIDTGNARLEHGVVDFTREQAQAILRYLLDTPDQKFSFSYCRVFPAELQRPDNRPLGLKPDLLGRMPWVIGLLALWPFLLGIRLFPYGLIPGWAKLLIGFIILLVAIWLVGIDVFKLWRKYNSSQPVVSLTTGADAVDPWAVVGLLVAVICSFAMLFRPWEVATILFVVAMVLGVYARKRPRLVWSGGRPSADPRILVRMDSWQVLLIGLGEERDAVHDAVVADLRSGGEDSLRVADEKIWHWGVDGKVERVQTVVGMRSAIAFMHFHAYDGDLYVAWDAHVNRGTWIETPVATGTAIATGALCEVRTIASGERKISEYDVSDGNCVIERVHAVVTRVIKHQLALHKLDQEINFAIVREQRPGQDTDAPATGLGARFAGLKRKA